MVIISTRNVLLSKQIISRLPTGIDLGPTVHQSSAGARCSSVVRAFAHDAIGRQIDSSWCSTTGVTKDMVCVILSVG